MGELERLVLAVEASAACTRPPTATLILTILLRPFQAILTLTVRRTRDVASSERFIRRGAVREVDDPFAKMLQATRVTIGVVERDATATGRRRSPWELLDDHHLAIAALNANDPPVPHQAVPWALSAF